MSARQRREESRPNPPRLALHGTVAVGAREARLASLAAWAVAGLLGVALLLMALGPHRVGDYMTETDFYGAYAEGARLVQHGRLEPARYGVVGPGFEVALALVGFVVRDLFLAAESISIASVLAIVLLWFALLRHLAGARVALIATLFMATNAYFFRFGYAATTDMFAIALQAGALAALFLGRGMRPVAIAGGLAAAAFLTRYNAIYLVPAAWIALLARGTQVDRRVRAALVFTAAFLAPVVPWVLYSLSQGGTVSLQLHHNIAYEVFARAAGIPWDTYQRTMQSEFGSLADVIARDPAAVLGRMLFNVWDHLRLDATRLLGMTVAAAAVVGLALGWRDGSLKRLWPLLVAGMLAFATLVPVFHSERYSLALLPIYAMLAGLAFGSPLAAMAVGRARRVWLKTLLAAVPLAFALGATWKLQTHVVSQLPIEVLSCAETLRTLSRPGDRVVARKAHIAYHAGVASLAFPFVDTLPELAAYARQGDARWLYFSWPEAETRPRFWFLLDTTAVVPGLTVRRATVRNAAVLYEIGPDFGRIPDWFANDTLRALHDARAKLLVNGRDKVTLARYAMVLRSLGRHEESARALDRLVQLDPGDLPSLLMLGDAFLRSGQLELAARVFSDAETRHPGSADARRGRGWASLLARDPARAAELWRPIIAATNDVETLERMIALYASLGDRAAEQTAREMLARARGNS